MTARAFNQVRDGSGFTRSAPKKRLSQVIADTLLTVVCVVPVWIARAYVARILWRWCLAPATHGYTPTFVAIIGVIALMGLLRPNAGAQTQGADSVVLNAAAECTLPFLVLAIVWIILLVGGAR